MKFKILIGAALSSVVLATSSFAATLSLVGGTDTVLSADFSLGGVAADNGLVVGTTAVKTYSTADGTAGGLALDGSSTLSFTYLGSSAGAENTAFAVGGSELNNKSSVAGVSSVSSTHIFDATPGAENLVDFVYSTIFTNPAAIGSISNVSGISGYDGNGLSMTFFRESDTSFLAFFGDGRGDNDMDDMVVRIAAVPLPAGGLLLISAFGGFAAFRRRKSKQA